MRSLMLSAGAVGLCVGLVLVGLIRFPPSPLSRPLLQALVCATLWGLGSLLTDASSAPGVDQIGIAIAYTGGIFVPPLWWVVAVRWASSRSSVPPLTERWVQIPLAWAALIWLAMITNPWHGLFLTPIDGERSEYGIFWWMMALPNHALGIATAGLALWVFGHVGERDVRWQALLVVAASLLVGLSHLTFVFWPTTPEFDAPVIALAAASSFILIAMRSEAEHRHYAEVLRKEVRERTRQLEQANRALRNLQSRLLAAERLGAGEELAGSVAHAINNPLTALLGTVEMELESRTEGDPALERVLKLGRRAKEVVERTLLLFRRGRLQLGPHAPMSILADVIADVEQPAAERGIVIETKVASGLPPIVVDRALLVEALSGIARNALEAMGHGGTLWMEAEWLRGLDIVELRISDSGPGIPPELRETVFEPFFTTKGGGTGLGLAITRGVIQGHGGRIRIQERLGGGAAVCIELPAHRRD